ncbi:MAG: VanW family protein, partial [Litorilinea sp.]
MQSSYPSPAMPSTRPGSRRFQSRGPQSRIRRGPGDFAAIFMASLLLALVGLGLWWQVWHTNRIYMGVSVGGVPVGAITRAAALSRLEEAYVRHPLPPISIQHGEQQWPITADHVRGRVDLLAAVNQAYLVGRQGDWSQRFGNQFDAVLGGINITPSYDVDASQLRRVVNQLAAQVRSAPRAEVRVGDTVIPAQPGLDVDVETTVQSLLSQLENRASGVAIITPLQVLEIAPQTATAGAANTETTTDAVADNGTSRAPVRGSLLLRDAAYGLEFALDPAAIHGLLLSDNPVTLDIPATRELLIQWSQQINISPRDARLRFDQATNSPVILQTSRPGRQLDVDATLSAIQVALTTGSDSAPLAIRSVPPAVDSNRIAEMGIRELVGSGSSYFAGSSAARVRNIEISAEKFDGVVIPPGGIFSFNHFVEDVSAANGFEDSLIIWGDRTAVGIGGGICQVSTTIFRAAYFTGMPIVERYNHGYIVDWYGEPGLDATIYTPTVDFRFRNDTVAYLLIEPVVDTVNGVMTFNLYGTKPDRTVTVSDA